MSTPLEPLDKAICLVIKTRQAVTDTSSVYIETVTGIKKGVFMTIRKGQRAVTLGELEKIAACMGTTAKSIFEEAQASIN
jgi:hypothetical protein